VNICPGNTTHTLNAVDSFAVNDACMLHLYFLVLFCRETLSSYVEHYYHNRGMNLDRRIVNVADVERLKNCGEELSLETVELLNVDELCGDDSDDSW